jgi:hypothetical protein
MNTNTTELFNQLKNLITLITSSSDDVDEYKFKKLLKKITVDSFQMTFFEVQIETKPDSEQRRYLQTVWSTYRQENEHIVSVKKDDGSYSGQTTYAYDVDKPLWITEKNKQNLWVDNAEYVDSWSRLKDIPPYWDCEEGSDIKTSIIIPLKVPEMYRPFGFINFESAHYMKCNDELKQIFRNIADIVAIYIHLVKINKFKKEHVANMMDTLNELEPLIGAGAVPKVFIAYPKRIDPKVKEVIRRTTREYSGKFDFIYWEEIEKTGDINEHIISSIMKCRYGIAYFMQQEDSHSSGAKFTYNPNVFFEAGMFQLFSQQNKASGVKREWIPIKEAKIDLPFDLRNLRAIEVQRNDNGELNEHCLQVDLEEKMNSW